MRHLYGNTIKNDMAIRATRYPVSIFINPKDSILINIVFLFVGIGIRSYE